MIRKKKTKEIILEKALSLFAIHGYNGVFVGQIAEEVGIKTPSLYKHFKSKQEIFDTLLSEVASRVEKARNKLTVPIDENTADTYMNMKLNELGNMCFALMSFYLQDEYISKFRMMLAIERYNNPEAEKLFQKFFVDGPLEMETTLFREMIQKGHFIDCDPYVMALHFYSPLFLLIQKYDNTAIEPEKLRELIDQLVYSFSERYVNGGSRQ